MDPTPTPRLQSADSPASTQQRTGKRTVIALWLMIGPTALIVATLILYGVVNFLLGATAPESTADPALLTEQSPLRSVANIILFFIGATSVATWLPGMIIGIVLLATGKK